jgi:glycosyltransferase involved in cell wall biosynthesis
MFHYDLVVFSHLRWNFVYQRPQHLLSRAARGHRVFFLEEPVFDTETPWFETRTDPSGVTICVPHVSHDHTTLEIEHLTRSWLSGLLQTEGVHEYVTWFYTPMALPLSRNLHPKAVVYDCMDELSAFKFAPPELVSLERELMRRADVVFTGGHSLYEAKRLQHGNAHAMPSSVDVKHFAQARNAIPEPSDLANIPHPRVGFIGVVDERMDIELLGDVAQALPEVQFVIVGPVVKIDPAWLPQGNNLHYLGGKSYDELPAYLAHWDAAMMPFALNESTRYISPTKTPEYLAAGKPVVSTPIRDVVRPYGERDFVFIANDATSFASAVRKVLTEDQTERLERSDAFVSKMSWDATWRNMETLIDRAVSRSETSTPIQSQPVLPTTGGAGSSGERLPGSTRQR